MGAQLNIKDSETMPAFVVAPVTADQARTGHDAYRKFGLGSRHAARLNFGDCFAYTVSRTTGEPLLHKGEDFAQTDIAAA